MRNPFRSRTAVLVSAVALVVMVIGIFIVANASPSKPSVSFGNASRPSAAAPVAIIQPPSASDVARSLNCKRFHDLGSAPDAGVVDSGACWIGKVKYAINTFASSYVRDSWLVAAEPLGVVPKWETETSVTYKSVT